MEPADDLGHSMVRPTVIDSHNWRDLLCRVEGGQSWARENQRREK
jgi:hypothetical protein